VGRRKRLSAKCYTKAQVVPLSRIVDDTAHPC
jgi:hypothetical protein